MPGQTERGITLEKIGLQKKTQVLNLILYRSNYTLDIAEERIRTRKQLFKSPPRETD